MAIDDMYRRDTRNTVITPTPAPTPRIVFVVAATVAPATVPVPVPVPIPVPQQQHLQPTTNQLLAPIKNLGVTPTRFYRTKGALCFSNYFL